GEPGELEPRRQRPAPRPAQARVGAEPFYGRRDEVRELDRRGARDRTLRSAGVGEYWSDHFALGGGGRARRGDRHGSGGGRALRAGGGAAPPHGPHRGAAAVEGLLLLRLVPATTGGGSGGAVGAGTLRSRGGGDELRRAVGGRQAGDPHPLDDAHTSPALPGAGHRLDMGGLRLLLLGRPLRGLRPLAAHAGGPQADDVVAFDVQLEAHPVVAPQAALGEVFA